MSVTLTQINKEENDNGKNAAMKANNSGSTTEVTEVYGGLYNQTSEWTVLMTITLTLTLHTRGRMTVLH